MSMPTRVILIVLFFLSINALAIGAFGLPPVTSDKIYTQHKKFVIRSGEEGGNDTCPSGSVVFTTDCVLFTSDYLLLGN
jgi:hypothetical protein